MYSTPVKPILGNIKVKYKLLIPVFVVLIPMVLYQISYIKKSYHQDISSAYRVNRELATATCAALSNHLNSIWGLEQALGSAILIGGNNMNLNQIDKLMYEQLATIPTVESITWVDTRGRVLASTNEKMDGISISDRVYFRDIIQGDDNTASDLVYGYASKKPVVAVAKAIRLRGRLRGVVVAILNPDYLNKVLPAKRSGRSAVGIIDQNRRIIYRTGMPPGLPLDERHAVRGMGGRALAGMVEFMRGFQSRFDPSGELRMGVGVPFSDTGWAVFASMPISQVTAEARANMKNSIFILVCGTALSLFAALLVVNHLLKRVRTLQESAVSMTEGNFSSRANLSGSDELADAGTALDRLADRIQTLETDRNRFLQTAAHELRNPMAIIKGICSLMIMKGLSQISEEDFRKKLDVVVREIDRLSSFLNEILDAFRFQEGQLSLKMEKVCIDDVIYDAIYPLTAGENEHKVRFEPSNEDDLYVLGDFKRLEEVVRNLVGNAVKYSPQGGNITVRLKGDGSRILVSITDQGVGIPKADESRIFQSFFRASNLNATDPGGMGLGLYVCKNIVERHGGRIWFETQEGAGSTFYVELPALTWNSDDEEPDLHGQEDTDRR